MPITAKYDAEARAIYARMRNGEVATSIEIDDEFVIDQDSNGIILGVEALTVPVSRDQLAALAERFGFVDRLDNLWSEVRSAQPVVPTRSGAAVYCAVQYSAVQHSAMLAPLLAVGVSSASIDVETHEYA